MYCRLDIKNELVNNIINHNVTTNKIKQLTNNSIVILKDKFPKESEAFKVSESLIKSINSSYKDNIASSIKITDGYEVKISPSDSLVDKYYDEYIKNYNELHREDTSIDKFGDSSPVFSKKETDEIETEEVLKPILENLKSRFSIDYEFINNPKLNWAGQYDYKSEKVKINLAKASLDTPFHEFAHPFIRIVRNTNRPLYNKFARELDNTTEGKGVLNQVKKDYPELDVADQIEEAIVTVIGLHAKGKLKSISLIARVKEILKDILNKLGITSINPEELPLMSMAEFAGIMVSDLNIDVSSAKYFDKGKVSKSVKDIKIKQESAFKQQAVFFARRIKTLESQLKNLDSSSDKYNKLSIELRDLKKKFSSANETQNVDDFYNLGIEVLNKVESFIFDLENGRTVSDENLEHTISVIETFEEFPNLSDKSKNAFRRLYPFLSAKNLEQINIHSNENVQITQEIADRQNKDIGSFKKWVGSLSDSPNYYVRTIGSVIKAAQNSYSSKNKELAKLVQKEVDLLNEYAKSNGKTIEQIYDMFIQSKKNDIILVQQNTEDGKPNPNYKEITETKELKRFYDFYRNIIMKSEAILPTKFGPNFIPNISEETLKDKLSKIFKPEEFSSEGFVGTDGLYADIIEMKYLNKISSDKKSKDLGGSLLLFAAAANEYKEMSAALPKVRLLQHGLTYKQASNGMVIEKTFISFSDPSKSYLASQSNMVSQVKTVIDMQLKGQMRPKQWGITISETIDSEGITHTKKIFGSDIIDHALKYNSMLKIGFSPITAGANVIFGDISNIIESIGGQFFGVKDLHNATSIFIKNSYKDDSLVDRLLEDLNPLQELDDYTITEGVKIKKKMSAEKLQEYMYSMQKVGEKYLQSRTMLALMIKEGYLTSNGNLTNKYKDLSAPEKLQLSDKIQRVNQLIHGRYSQREAASLQQNVLYRMSMQFRKWIPSAIEQRVAVKQFDNRLGVEVEGRYLTISRLFFNKEGFSNLQKAFKGELNEMEMYNLKKTVSELIMAASVMLLAAWAHGDDDDSEAKKRRKMASIKLALSLLDRASGDLTFFYSPKQLAHTVSNSAALVKTLDDVRIAIGYFPSIFGDDNLYKSGPHKGENKFITSLLKVTLGGKQIQDITTIFNKNPIYEPK